MKIYLDSYGVKLWLTIALAFSNCLACLLFFFGVVLANTGTPTNPILYYFTIGGLLTLWALSGIALSFVAWNVFKMRYEIADRKLEERIAN